jgi:predicted dehydrogenase
MTNETKSIDSPSASRRRFLQASAAGAAALTGLSLVRSVHAAGDETIKIGMIGCGDRCSGAAAQSMKAGPYVKLVAMSDVFVNRALAHRNTLKRMYPDQVLVDDDHCFGGFDGQKKVIDAADVVLIACASKFHAMYAEWAIKAGKHVFVEKPHAIDPVGCRRMQAAADLAKQKGLSIVSGLQSRFSTGYQETVKRIHDGAIGDIVAVQSMFLRGPYQTVRRDPKLTETQYQFSNWYHFCWLSGDDVTQSLVHNLDRVAWLMKEEMPKWCFGLGGRSASYGEVYGDMYDHDTVVYEYASGARVYALCRTQNGCYGNSSDIIMGSKGKCDFGPWGNNPYDAEQKALIDSVRNGKPINSGYHMANSTLMGVMGQLACYSGQPITWEQVSKSDFQFGPPPEQANFETKPVMPDKSGNYPLPMPGITKII